MFTERWRDSWWLKQVTSWLSYSQGHQIRALTVKKNTREGTPAQALHKAVMKKKKKKDHQPYSPGIKLIICTMKGTDVIAYRWVSQYPLPCKSSSTGRISEEGRGRFGRDGFAQIESLLGSTLLSSVVQTKVNTFKMKDTDAKNISCILSCYSDYSNRHIKKQKILHQFLFYIFSYLSCYCIKQETIQHCVTTDAVLVFVTTISKLCSY